MKIKFLLIASGVFLFSFLTTEIKAQVDVGDSLALVDLYNSTGGTGWNYHTNWLTKKPVSTWFGVGVKNRKVVQVDLNLNNLTGKIPESIGDFDSIVDLQMYNNELTGSIPSSIGKLKTLHDIYLFGNTLSGEIPSSMGSMTSLEAISMGDNQFIGELPSSLGNCPKLSTILLYNNKLTGNIPLSFKNLLLIGLELDHNLLSGELQDVFAEHCPLEDLNLTSNNFSGSIPTFFSRFSDLYELYLANNYFTGLIPAELANLKSIVYLDLSYNELTGDIPTELFNLPNMVIMYLNNNALTFERNVVYSGHNGYKYITPTYFLENNHLTFNGLEFLAQRFKFVSYNPQALLPIHIYQNKLAVSAGGTLSNNTYQWFQKGLSLPVTIAGDSTYEPTASGIYYAKITNLKVKNLILKTDTLHYTMPLAKSEMNITISPNPAINIISIHGLNEKSNAKITIADMSGYVWMRAFSRQQSAMKVDVSRLKAGNYVVNMSDGNEMITKEFIKE